MRLQRQIARNQRRSFRVRLLLRTEGPSATEPRDDSSALKPAGNGEAALEGSLGQTELRILEGIRDIVRDVLDDDSISINMATTARDVAGWDSLANIRIILATEKAFGIKVSTTDLMALRDVGDFVRLVASRRPE